MELSKRIGLFAATAGLGLVLAAAPASAGRPADGSVGNANGKTPPGQSAGDKNKGHECDDNKGIGQGNPAHARNCAPPPPPPPPSGD